MCNTGPSFRHAFALLGLLSSLCIMGGSCDGDEQPGAPAGKAATGAPPIVSIEAPDKVAFGSGAEITVRVENRAAHPIVVVDGIVRLGTDEVGHAGPPLILAAKRLDPTTLALEGAYQVEDIGPEARVPAPPRWQWAGAERVAFAPILSTGDAWTFTAHVEAATTVVGLVATVRYATLPASAKAYRLAAVEVEASPGSPGGPAGRSGWATVGRAGARLEETSDVAKGATAATTEKPSAPPDLSLPRLYPFALTSDALASLVLVAAQTSAALEVEKPAFDLAAARARAGVPAGPAVYFGPLPAWLLEDGAHGTSVLAGPDLRIAVRGRAAPLVAALNQRESVSLTLYERSPNRDPDGLAKRLLEAGLAPSERGEKGGGFTGSVEVARAQLIPVLAQVEASGLALDGTHVIHPP